MRITSTMPPHLIARILRRYCEEREIAQSRLGRTIANDPRLIFDLRDGREPRARMIERINAALAGEA